MPTRTVLIIGCPTRRALIKGWLTANTNLELIGEIGSPTSLELAAQLAPDIVVLDCAAPHLNPLVILPLLRALPGTPQIVALGATGCAGERALVHALGATAYALPERTGELAKVLGELRTTKPTAAIRADQPTATPFSTVTLT